MALYAMNPDLVRLLLQRGAVPRTHRGPFSAAALPSLFSVVPPMWVTHPSDGDRPKFEVTLAAWDAYAAEMIALIAPRWPDADYAELHVWFGQRKMPLSIAALKAAGVAPPPPEKPEP
jgi:hypothetical protein